MIPEAKKQMGCFIETRGLFHRNTKAATLKYGDKSVEVRGQLLHRSIFIRNFAPKIKTAYYSYDIILPLCAGVGHRII